MQLVCEFEASSRSREATTEIFSVDQFWVITFFLHKIVRLVLLSVTWNDTSHQK